MQLRPLLGARLGLALALAVPALLAAPARATQDAQSRVTLFEEPSKTEEVRVLHPQLDAATTLGPDFRFGVGYAVDIVSGATPAIFGPHSGVDAVTTATKFSDLRQEVHANISYERPASSVAFAYAYGWEHDYRSQAITGTTRSDLLDHNFTLGLSYTHNFDSVCDQNNSNIGDQPLDLKPLINSAHCFNSAMPDVVSQRLSIDTFQPSLSWTATPRLVLQLGSTVQILDGFQSNPYRSVQLGREQRTPQEHLPEYRQRYAVYTRAVYALPAVRSSALAMVRGYQDSWAVQAVSGEVLLNKYFGPSMILTLRGRYHLQSGASFYRDGAGYRDLGPGGQYWTGDRELSPMSNYLGGAKIAILRRPEQERSALFVEMELNLKYELLVYHLESADAPNADRTHAHIVQAAFSLRF